MKGDAIQKILCFLLTYGLMVFCAAGCNSARYYREEADHVSYKIIQEAQQEALNRTEPFTIERPADTLRRRLLIDQKLTHAGSASMGTTDLTPIKQWPDDDYLDASAERRPPNEPWTVEGPLRLSLMDALQIAARDNREYQSEKERVYQVALDLDLERDFFRFTWAGAAESLFSSELNQEVVINEDGDTDPQAIRGIENTGSLGVERQFKHGLTVTGLIGLDLVTLLTQERTSSRGVFADGTIAVPLLRGSSKFVVTEPLTQAERNVVYAIYGFERFKRVFAVDVASDYLGVLQELDRLKNAEASYRRVITSTRWLRRHADAGRYSPIEVDQARQDELRERNRWIAAGAAYERRLDGFKILLGLPADADVEMDPAELTRLNTRAGQVTGPATAPAEEEGEGGAVPADAPIELIPPGRENAGPLELEEGRSIGLAIENRLDLRVVIGRVDDAQRQAAVAADTLRADLTLLGSGSIGQRRTLGSSDELDANLRFNEGRYSALLGIDLPLERTAERNLYRNSLIALERSVRDVQELEDQIKLEIRNNLRDLLEARETVRIQAEAVKVAERRVASTEMLMKAGRGEVRDALEAQEALLSAQNAFTSALVQYRVAELEMQRDLGVLEVDEEGLWREFTPEEAVNGGD